MPLTPVEIHHQHLRRGLFGYKRGAVDALMEEISDSFATVWRERADLADRVEQLEAEVARYNEMEGLLRETLVSAERASHDMKEQARKEAELIVAEAHTESRSVTRDAASKKERLEGDLRRVQALLRSALAATEEWPGGKAPDEEDTDGGIRRIAG